MLVEERTSLRASSPCKLPIKLSELTAAIACCLTSGAALRASETKALTIPFPRVLLVSRVTAIERSRVIISAGSAATAQLLRLVLAKSRALSRAAPSTQMRVGPSVTHQFPCGQNVSCQPPTSSVGQICPPDTHVTLCIQISKACFFDKYWNAYKTTGCTDGPT